MKYLEPKLHSFATTYDAICNSGSGASGGAVGGVTLCETGGGANSGTCNAGGGNTELECGVGGAGTCTNGAGNAWAYTTGACASGIRYSTNGTGCVGGSGAS